MQVEIKSVKSGKSDYGEYKCVELDNGTKYFVGADKPPYKFINVGYVGSADIETAKSKKGTEYIRIFKQVGNTQPTQTAQKPHQQANKVFNGYAKKDPAGIALEILKRKHTSWIGCLQCSVNFHKFMESKTNDEVHNVNKLVDYAHDVVKITNHFYDALCEKIDKKKDGTCEPQKSDSNNNNINNDIHRKTGPIETKADEHPEVLENENEDIQDVSF